MLATELWCQRNCNTAFEISELTLAVTQHYHDRNCGEGDLWLCVSGKGSCNRVALLPLPVGQLITCMSLSWQESTGLSPPPAPEAPLSLWGVSPVLTGVWPSSTLLSALLSHALPWCRQGEGGGQGQLVALMLKFFFFNLFIYIGSITPACPSLMCFFFFFEQKQYWEDKFSKDFVFYVCVCIFCFT